MIISPHTLNPTFFLLPDTCKIHESVKMVPLHSKKYPIDEASSNSEVSLPASLRSNGI